MSWKKWFKTEPKNVDDDGFRLHQCVLALENKLLKIDSWHASSDHWLGQALNKVIEETIYEMIRRQFEDQRLERLIEQCCERAIEDIYKEFSQEIFQESLKTQLKEKFISELRSIVKFRTPNEGEQR